MVYNSFMSETKDNIDNIKTKIALYFPFLRRFLRLIKDLKTYHLWMRLRASVLNHLREKKSRIHFKRERALKVTQQLAMFDSEIQKSQVVLKDHIVDTINPLRTSTNEELANLKSEENFINDEIAEKSLFTASDVKRVSPDLISYKRK